MTYFSLSVCSSFLRSSSTISHSLSSSSSSLLARGEWLCPWPRGRWAIAGVLLCSSLSPSLARDFLLSLSRSGDTGELSVFLSAFLVSAWLTEKRPTFLCVLPWADGAAFGGEDWGTGVTWWQRMWEILASCPSCNEGSDWWVAKIKSDLLLLPEIVLCLHEVDLGVAPPSPL